MADQRKVELILGIRATGAADAAASVDSISKVAAQLSNDLTALQRADVLKDLATTAAQAAVQLGETDRAALRLATELNSVGASEKEIRKVSQEFERTVATLEKARAAQEKLGAQMAKDAEKARATQEKLGAQMAADIEAELRAQTKLNEQRRLAATGASTLQKELGQIARAEQIQKVGAEMGLFAKKTKDVSGAVAELNKKLKELGASDDEIRGAAGAFNTAQTNGTTNRLARVGAEIRNLPSTQIPGLGIGTDAVGNFLRLGGAITGISEKAAETSKVAQALSPHLGQAAAGFVAMGVQMAPFIIVAGAVGLAIKSLTDEAGRSADAINKTVDAQRSANEEIVAGLTSDEVRKKLEDLATARQLEQEVLDKTTAAYADFERQTQEAADSGKDLAATLTEIIFGQGATVAGAKAVRADEEALNQQRETSVTNLAELDAKTADYNTLLESGALAANDAADAEKRLAEERSKTALTSADNAAKELQAQQRALNATGEQNEKRLQTIEDEKDVLQRQIDVLTESGVASEEVTAKLASLKDQLGLLGKESEFISSTALEASRQADAEKQAQKDAEDATKKAQQAQEQYTKAVDSAATSFQNAQEDIGTRLAQTLEDNTLKFGRDLAALDTKFRQDMFDADLKAQRAERDAALDQIDDLNKIREDARKEQEEALREGDFKALFLARQKGAEELKQDQDEFAADRQRNQRRQQDALEDLKRNDERQREARRTGYDQQNTDARTNQQRELAQARLAQNRALAQASASLNAELGIRQQFWNAVVGQAKQALGQVNGMQKPAGANATSPFGSFQGTFTAIQQVVRK